MWLWGPILSRLVHETSQSRGGKGHLSKLRMQNWFSEEHVYWWGGISGPSWDFLNLTPPGNHLYLCSNSQLHLAGMEGASRVSISNQSPRDTCTVEAKALDRDSELGRAFILGVRYWTGLKVK